MLIYLQKRQIHPMLLMNQTSAIHWNYAFLFTFDFGFILFQMFYQCSVLFFVLFHLLSDRAIRQALNNHIIIVLLVIGLIYEVTSVPLMLYWYRFGNTWKYTLGFSHFWTFVDYLCYSTQLVGFAWASIERHILVFHSHWISTKKKRFLVHYLPLITLMIYSFTYCFVFIVFPFCEEFIPTSLIIILNIGLFLRVIWQKSRINRSVEWRKQRKMTIQLLSTSVLYFIFMGPRTVFQFCRFIGLETRNILMLFYHSAFFANYIMFLFPYVCYGAMPELKKKLRKSFFYQKQQQQVIGSGSSVRNYTASEPTRTRI